MRLQRGAAEPLQDLHILQQFEILFCNDLCWGLAFIPPELLKHLLGGVGGERRAQLLCQLHLLGQEDGSVSSSHAQTLSPGPRWWRRRWVIRTADSVIPHRALLTRVPLDE